MNERIVKINRLITILAGVLTVIWIAADPSEKKNAVLFGFSALRLGMLGYTLGLLIAVVFLYNGLLKIRRPVFPAVFFGWLLLVGSSAVILLSGRIREGNILSLIVSRALPLLLFCALSGGLFCLSANAFPAEVKQENGRKAGALFAAAVLICLAVSTYLDSVSWEITLKQDTLLCLLTAAAGLLWGILHDRVPGKDTPAGTLFFLIFGFCAIRFTEMWMGRVNTPSNAYWGELAESFLHGRLCLEHPGGFHDLTQYNGNWYVPNPPMPAILLMPAAALLGSGSAINMALVSAVFGGINAGLTFLLLRKADEQKLFELPLSGCIWLTVSFIFGSDHLWLATTGQMWFISQVLVIGFTLLAALLTVCKKSPVLIGIMLGCGVLCRPNIFPVYLCLLGIYLWQQHDFPKLDFGKAFVWCLKSGIPVVISVGLLLYYNFIRFEDPMDFGYVTINGADWILESVQQYGMFHPHFIPVNLQTMLLLLPRLDFSGSRFWFYPYVAGYSIFLMSPCLVYAFRDLKKNWWIIGSGASVLLTVALLVCYHNTGAEQIGYRYILDASAPLLLLVGKGMKGKSDPLFKVLTCFAVLLAFVSIHWWYLGRI